MNIKSKKVLFLSCAFFLLYCISVALADSKTEKLIHRYTNLQDFSVLKDFIQLADSGNTDASFYVGRMYHAGHGVTKNYEIAKKYYLISAKAENVKAMNNLGVLFEQQYKNYESAKKWYEIAAKREFPTSQMNLAILYCKGLGVNADYEKAEKLISLSSKNGKYVAGYEFHSCLAKRNIYPEKSVKWALISSILQGLDKKKSLETILSLHREYNFFYELYDFALSIGLKDSKNYFNSVKEAITWLKDNSFITQSEFNSFPWKRVFG